MTKKIPIVFALLLVWSQAKSEDISQQTTNDSIPLSYSINEITVTSFKSNDDLRIQPVSATLLTSDDIRKRNITSIKDFSAVVPNLFAPDYGFRMTSPAYIRGIGSRTGAPAVGLYVDGIPYFERTVFDFNLNDIDRMEVLRGPQGTLYGRNTMGGIINVYTKSPFKYKETNLSLSAGNYNNYRVDASHYGNINQTFGYAISGNYTHNGGYFRNTYNDKKVGVMDAATARIRLSWRITPRLNAHLTSSYDYSNQNGMPYATYNKDDNNIGDINYDGNAYYIRNISSNGLELNYITDNYKLSSMSSFQYFGGRQDLDQDFTSEPKVVTYFTHSQRMYSQEFNIKSIEKKRYEWQFGVFGFHQNHSNLNDVEMNLPPVPSHIIRDISTPITGMAIYHQSTINDILTKGLSAILGIRYDYEEDKLERTEMNAKNGLPFIEAEPIKAKNSYSEFTPKISLQYTHASNNTLYITVTEGYKAGGFNTTADEDKDMAFKPEYSWSYEIGTKLNLINNTWDADASVFYIDWRDQQITQRNASEKGYVLRNAGKSISKGFEISTTVYPAKNLNIQLNYGYTHAKFKDYEYETVPDRNTQAVNTINYGGNYLPLVPSNTLAVSVNYTIDTKSEMLDKIVLNAQYQGLGKLYWNEDNQGKQNYYNTINAGIAFVKNKLSIDLWAKNITNEEYISYKLVSSGKDFAQRGKPFTCGANINLKF